MLLWIHKQTVLHRFKYSSTSSAVRRQPGRTTSRTRVSSSTTNPNPLSLALTQLNFNNLPLCLSGCSRRPVDNVWVTWTEGRHHVWMVSNKETRKTEPTTTQTYLCSNNTTVALPPALITLLSVGTVLRYGPPALQRTWRHFLACSTNSVPVSHWLVVVVVSYISLFS